MIIVSFYFLSCNSNQGNSNHNGNSQNKNIVFNPSFNYKNCFNIDSLKRFYIVSNDAINKSDFLLHFSKVEMIDSFGVLNISNDSNKIDLIKFVYKLISGEGTDDRFNGYHHLEMDSTLGAVSNAIKNNHYPEIHIDTYSATGIIDTTKITAVKNVFGYLEGNISKEGKIYTLYFDFGNGGSMTFFHFIMQDGNGFPTIISKKDLDELKKKMDDIYNIKYIYNPDKIKYLSSNKYQLSYRGYLSDDAYCCPKYSITLTGLLTNNELRLLDDIKVVENKK